MLKEKLYTIFIQVITIAWVYITPVHDVIIGVSILVTLDFMTGILASRKIKKKITSRGFRQTVSKTFSYQGTIVVAMIIEKHLVPGIPVIKIISSFIVLTEAKSFFENVEVLTGINFWEKLTSKVTSLLKKDK